MAYEISSDYFLPAGRLLVQADEDENSCIGTIVRIGMDENWGCFRSAFRFSMASFTKLVRKVQDPEYVPPGPEEPYEEPGQIITEYTRVVFNRDMAQEVRIENEDYFIIHVNDILALIPPD